MASILFVFMAHFFYICPIPDRGLCATILFFHYTNGSTTHEANISTESPEKEEQARVSRENEIKGRPESAGPPPRQGPLEADGQR
jgi:hypothetical protein